MGVFNNLIPSRTSSEHLASISTQHIMMHIEIQGSINESNGKRKIMNENLAALGLARNYRVRQLLYVEYFRTDSISPDVSSPRRIIAFIFFQSKLICSFYCSQLTVPLTRKL